MPDRTGWGWTGEALVNTNRSTADGGTVNNWGQEYPYGGIVDLDTGVVRPLPILPVGREPLRISSYRQSLPPGPGRYQGDLTRILDVEAEEWIEFDWPDGAPEHGGSIVWVGDRLFVWGGFACIGVVPRNSPGSSMRDGDYIGDRGWLWDPAVAREAQAPLD